MSFENTTQSQFYHAGFLEKLGENTVISNWKKRWFVLKDNQLYYFKKEGDIIPIGKLNLATATNVKYLTDKKDERKFVIKLLLDNGNFTLVHLMKLDFGL